MKTNVRAFYKHRDEELNFNGLNNKNNNITYRPF